MHPVPAEVTAWRYTWSMTSPAANTPGTLVAVGIAIGAAPHVYVSIAHIQLAFEQLRVRRVSDRDEHTGQLDLLLALAVGAFDPDTGNAGLIAQDFVEDVIPRQADITAGRFVEQLLLQHFFRAQLVTPMHQRDFGGDIGEI